MNPNARFPLPSTLYRTLMALAAALSTGCGGGGSSGTETPSVTGPQVTSITTATPRYGQPLLVTVQGTELDADVGLSSAGCSGMTRSTTAPTASTATTAYYTCTVKAMGEQSLAAVRSSTGASLRTQTYSVPAPQVTMSVSNGSTVAGDFVMTLAPDKTPATVDNFLGYVNSGFYDGTVFHRVIKGFVVQGGGFLPDGAQRPATSGPIALEVGKGLSNVQWSVAMARTSVLDSATTQFFVNTVDNVALDTASGGYAVFGSVTTNSALVAAIENVPCTSPSSGFCVPDTPVVISSARQTR